jgi:hypothetical protein
VTRTRKKESREPGKDMRVGEGAVLTRKDLGPEEEGIIASQGGSVLVQNRSEVLVQRRL